MNVHQNSRHGPMRDYHEATKHSWVSVRNSSHFLDWQNQPRPYKLYLDLEPIYLPEPDQTGRPALSPAPESAEASLSERPLRLQDLSALLYLSAGITRRRKVPGGEISFRAAPCTGALYEIDIYVVCEEIEHALAAGVYHFNPADFSLRRLRQGDCRGFLVRASAGEPQVSQAPAILVCTGTYWRNAWKYQARTYRHFGWDNGTILANLLAAAAARDLPAKVVSGFLDEDVNRLLGLDDSREVALNLVPVGHTALKTRPAPGDFPAISLRTVPSSAAEVDYPAMRALHTASSLIDAEEVARWRGTPPARILSGSADIRLLDPLPHSEFPEESLERVIIRRGSTRQFARESISFRQLSTCLLYAIRGVNADFLEPYGSRLNDMYLVAHAVEGLDPGSYALQGPPWGLERLKTGDFRSLTGRLGLEQNLAADCSAAVFFLAGLDPIFERFGNRGYRTVQLEAGILGGRLYLAAYAQRLGATGLTFYDDEVTEFFSPHARGKSAIFLVTLGKPDRRISARYG